MASDILDKIVELRRKDKASLGSTLGCDVPATRQRKPPVPFIAQKGVILEIKRASPSKGDIAPQLDERATALSYIDAGTSAISVLTEQHYFKGSLIDLQSVCAAVDQRQQTGAKNVAVLRKDFLIDEEDIDIAYRCGADAVLIIARILEDAQFTAMIQKCTSLGMTAFIELRKDDDVRKLSLAAKDKNINRSLLVCGVNARDLSDFTIDLLSPAGLLSDIQGILGPEARVVFESGIRSSQAAYFAGSLGFTGMLLGEAAARNPAQAKELVEGFMKATQTKNAQSWLRFANLLHEKKRLAVAEEHCEHSSRTPPPLLKVCGLTQAEDALAAAVAGADMLGFIFSSKSPRKTDGATVRNIRRNLQETGMTDSLFLVAVITETESTEAQEAIQLAREGIVDFLQLHGEHAVKSFLANDGLSGLPHYPVINLSRECDSEAISRLASLGEPRILIDSKCGEQLGGTGKQVSADLLTSSAGTSRLWLAGGLNADNITTVAAQFKPELVDVSSGIESSPGKKDLDKLERLVLALGM